MNVEISAGEFFQRTGQFRRSSFAARGRLPLDGFNRAAHAS